MGILVTWPTHILLCFFEQKAQNLTYQLRVWPLINRCGSNSRSCPCDSNEHSLMPWRFSCDGELFSKHRLHSDPVSPWNGCCSQVTGGFAINPGVWRGVSDDAHEGCGIKLDNYRSEMRKPEAPDTLHNSGKRSKYNNTVPSARTGTKKGQGQWHLQIYWQPTMPQSA